MAGVGGSEKLVDNLSVLLGRNYDVFQASFDPPGAPRYFDSSVPIIHLGPIPILPPPLRWWAYIVSAVRLRRMKKRLGISVTISTIWRGDLISVLSGCGDKKIALIPINILNNPTNRLLAKFHVVGTLVYRRFDKVLAISSHLAGEVDSFFRLHGTVGVFKNFVSPQTPSRLLPSDNIRRYVFCARFVPEKNLEGLIHVWAEFNQAFPKAQLVLIGDGPLSGHIQKLTLQLGLSYSVNLADASSAIVFLGALSNPIDYMVGARACVLSSRDEGTPGVLLLALSAGLPLIAADAHGGGVREVMGCNADSVDESHYQLASCGMLLPIPDHRSRASLHTWVEALRRIEEDDFLHEQLSIGASIMAKNYGPDAVKGYWLEMIDTLGAV